MSVHVDKDPFRVSVKVDGKTVVAEDNDARLRYQLTASGDLHTLTKVLKDHDGVYRVATDEPGRTARVTVHATTHGARIGVTLLPAKGVDLVFDSFDASAGDHFLGGGERSQGVDLRGQIVPIEVSAECAYAPVPFLASSAGWGLRLDTRNVSALAFPGSTGGAGCTFGQEAHCSFPPLADRVETCVHDASLTEDIYVGDFAAVLDAYEEDAGTPRPPPPAELGLIKWRDEVTGPGEVIEDITRLRDAGVPIGWVLVDNPWETCVGTLEFDHTRFPDPAGLIRQVHALGVRFMLWISPKVICGTGYEPSQFLGAPDNRVVDLTQRDTAQTFRQKIAALVALGIDGVKADRGDEVDLGASLQNEYAVLYAQNVAVAIRERAAIFRAATTGSQSVIPGLWAGDQSGDWTGLQNAIRMGGSAGVSGFPSWGSDIGGYQSQSLAGDVFARWAQLGAISPVFEVGGKGANATPWTLGRDAMDALRSAAVLHYELFPYLYGLLTTRQPVLRPLAFGFPDDDQAWKAGFELLVGPDLLAAPVTGSGTTPSVYLPKGDWVDLHTGSTLTGPLVFNRVTPMNELPLYVRDGAVLPFNLRTANGSWWSTDELQHPGRAGYLATNGAALSLVGLPHDVQIFVPADERPARVTLDGKAVSWTWAEGPLRGAVIRLHGPAVHGRIELSTT